MQQLDILALAGLRLDGRRDSEIRKIQHQLSVVETADGSVYYEQGLNKILVSIHGPREQEKKPEGLDHEKGYISCQIMNAPFTGFERKKRKMGDRRLHEIESIVIETFSTAILLDLYSRSEIMIVVHIFESDGSLICSILNAISLALMDAGISMKDIIVSCSVGVNKSGHIYYDVTQIEQTSGAAYLPIAISSNTKDIIYMQLDSRITIDLVQNALSQAQEGCEKILEIIESIIREDLTEMSMKLLYQR